MAGGGVTVVEKSGFFYCYCPMVQDLPEQAFKGPMLHQHLAPFESLTMSVYGCLSPWRFDLGLWCRSPALPSHACVAHQ